MLRTKKESKMEKILKDLNEAQREAVKTIDGSLLILAGAGSGKTKTITARLAYLIKLGIDPGNTLTLTFTNKAAREMRERALTLIENEIYPPLLCTFHKFGLLFLKLYIGILGRKNAFVIIDTEDKKRIIKNFHSNIATSIIANEISKYKNSLMEPEIALETAQLPNYKQIAKIYYKYEKYLQENNLVDFDDLIGLTYKILDTDKTLCKEISQKYHYIMIDEFQDTNELQYMLIEKLCSYHQNICVVGDDDQSIYGWRGANIKNIIEFPNKFDGTKIIKLEKNYRSTKTILDAANLLIEHNQSRLGKKLYTTLGKGKPIEILSSKDEVEESRKISKKVKKMLEEKTPASQIAILFRINALSRSIEEGLNRAKIPYKLIGAVRFYERAEIKDIISYFRTITNPMDDFSLKRVINKPKRGIGKVTVEKLETEAIKENISILQYLKNTPYEKLSKVVGKKSGAILKEFVKVIDYLQEVSKISLYKFIEKFESSIRIKDYYELMPDGMERTLNIDEFYGYFRDYIKQNPQNSLEDFLNEISLQSDQDQVEGNSIYLMSIHASKGLEFEYLFVIGMEEGFFPLLGEGSNMEEERRLGYVAFTRAKKELTLSYVQSRYYKGRRTLLVKSRFFKEAGLCEGSLVLEKTPAFKKGDLVKHKIFGIGRVIGVSRAIKEFKLIINFGGERREILSSYVKKL